MSRKKSKEQLEKRLNEIKTKEPKFKLRLNSKTIITLSDLKKVEYWKSLYPEAKLINYV